MSAEPFIPPLRELPARRLAERAEHLSAELNRSHRLAPRRRSIAIALAVLVLGAVLLATPAFGIRDRIAYLFGAENKPSNAIERYFSEQTGVPNGTEVLAKQARLAVQISIAGYGRQSLWWLRSRVAASAARHRSAPWTGTSHSRRRSSSQARSRTSTSMPGSRERPACSSGVTRSRGAAKLAAHYEDGSVDRTPIAWMGKPIEAGFFISEIPKSHWERARGSSHSPPRAPGTRAGARHHERPRLPAHSEAGRGAAGRRAAEGSASAAADLVLGHVPRPGRRRRLVPGHHERQGARARQRARGRADVKGAAGLVEEGALIAIDVDQNPDTGSAYYGTELEVALVGGDNEHEAEPVRRGKVGTSMR